MADIDKAKAALDTAMRKEEGERLTPYLCLAGRPTIGVGATTYLDGRKVTLADPPITRAQMDRMLSVELDRYIGAVIEMTEGHVGTNQLIGFVLCAYNIGIAGLRGSSMMKAHRAGNFAAAARAFTLWNKYRPSPGAPLQESPALTARRLRESAVYLTPDDDAPQQVMPQAVAAESNLAASPIAQSGAATAGAGVVTVLASAGDQLGPVGAVLAQLKTIVVETLGIAPEQFLPLVLVAAGAVVVWHRWKQRKGGWA